MALIRGSRAYLLEARGKLIEGKGRLMVDIQQAIRELGDLEGEITAIDLLLDDLNFKIKPVVDVTGPDDSETRLIPGAF